MFGADGTPGTEGEGVESTTKEAIFIALNVKSNSPSACGVFKRTCVEYTVLLYLTLLLLVLLNQSTRCGYASLLLLMVLIQRSSCWGLGHFSVLLRVSTEHTSGVFELA